MNYHPLNLKVLILNSAKMLALGLFVTGLAVLPEASFSQTADTKASAVAGVKVEIIDNSSTLSQAIAINQSGAVIGVREQPNEAQTIFSMVYFYADDQGSRDIPKLEGYTNLEAVALSDNGRVVGFASRPAGSGSGGLAAIVWDAATNEVKRLGCPDGYVGSHAQDITSDGTRITGYVTGAEPARMQPCLWTWKADEAKWEAEVLETRHGYNPFIMTGGTVISPDGKRIAASCTYEFIDERIVSALFLWQETEEGWKQKLIRDAAFFLHDMNDAGLIVGSISKNAQRVPCYLDVDNKLKMIDLLPGDQSGEAWGVDASGTIVGVSEDPHGPTGGPHAFMWKAGKTTAIELGDAPYSSAQGINESGQIAGMVDTVIESPGGPVEKTLAFRTIKSEASATPK